MSYFMAEDDTVTLTLECGETIEVIANVSAGKLGEWQAANKDNPEGMSRAMLGYCVKGWSFKDKDGQPVPCTIEKLYDLKFIVFMDIIKKVMGQYDIPFEPTT